MTKQMKQLILACGIALALCVLVSRTISASEETSLSRQPGGPFAWVEAASGAPPIEFWTQNGKTINEIPPTRSSIPHLVLHKNDLNPNAGERTLLVHVENITVPLMETCFATVTVKTQHGDPDLGGDAAQPPAPRITVWQESKPLSCNPDYWTVTHVNFSHEFTPTITVMSGTQHITIPTPTDYFWVDIQLPATGVGIDWPREYAFLMENQREAYMGHDFSQATPVPYHVRVYYCDMFPFGKKEEDPSTWLPRAQVYTHVRSSLIPTMRRVFDTEVNGWGMRPLHPDWDADDTLEVYVGAPQTWFHHEGGQFHWSDEYRRQDYINLTSSSGSYRGYPQLEHGQQDVFSHEFFHALQRNVRLRSVGDSDEYGYWKFFIEGQAILAESVIAPEIEFSGTRSYIGWANAFLDNHLNSPYSEINGETWTDPDKTAPQPYRAALYWRFLFERNNGIKYPWQGMQIIEHSLENMYTLGGDNTVEPETFELVMDETFKANGNKPFDSYENSLTAFARANYALRLENGRCDEA